MMGPAKLSTIRAELRKACNLSDAELVGWFDRQLERRAEATGDGDVELATLHLFRDALLREAQSGASRKKPIRGRGRAKAKS